jgi:excisionase family DNA binding protein
MTDNSEQTLTLSFEEAAGLLGISRGRAYELVHRGELAAIRLGRRILIPRQPSSLSSTGQAMNA